MNLNFPHSDVKKLTLPITSWLPDETLFSLCGRYHRVTGNALARTSAEQLFGHPRNGTQHDFPSRIDSFVARTQGVFGSCVHDIVRERTLANFYLPWRSQHQAALTLRCLCGDDTGTVKQRLGLLSSRFRAHHPLKVCPECRSEDIDHFSVPYWHLMHQYPGVWICVKHACSLKESTYKSSGVGRFLWCLPDEVNLYDSFDDHIEAAQTRTKLEGIAKTVISASHIGPGIHIDYCKLLHTYSSELRKKDLTRGESQFALQAIAQQYLGYLSGLEVVPELARLPITLDQAKDHVGRLLRMPRSGTHTLRHLLLIHWLFGSWEDFWQAYMAEVAPEHGNAQQSGRYERRNTDQQDQRGAFIRLIEDRGHSVSRAAKAMEIDPHTAAAWATAEGISTLKRSKLAPQTRTCLVQELKLGIDKAIVASKYGVSLQAITRMLRTEVGLQLAWHDARHMSRGQIARAKWTQNQRKYRGAGISTIRLLVPDAYSWLYRNDRAWLQEQSRHLPKAAPSNHARTDWIARDTALYRRVQKTILQLSIAKPDERITLQAVYQALPDLKPMLGKLHQLPLTRRTLKSALARPNGLTAQRSLLPNFFIE